jgi:hypothetical protein
MVHGVAPRGLDAGTSIAIRLGKRENGVRAVERIALRAGMDSTLVIRVERRDSRRRSRASQSTKGHGVSAGGSATGCTGRCARRACRRRRRRII